LSYRDIFHRKSTKVIWSLGQLRLLQQTHFIYKHVFDDANSPPGVQIASVYNSFCQCCNKKAESFSEKLFSSALNRLGPRMPQTEEDRRDYLFFLAQTIWSYAVFARYL